MPADFSDTLSAKEEEQCDRSLSVQDMECMSKDTIYNGFATGTAPWRTSLLFTLEIVGLYNRCSISLLYRRMWIISPLKVTLLVDVLLLLNISGQSHAPVLWKASLPTDNPQWKWK